APLLMLRHVASGKHPPDGRCFPKGAAHGSEHEEVCRRIQGKCPASGHEKIPVCGQLAPGARSSEFPVRGHEISRRAACPDACDPSGVDGCEVSHLAHRPGGTVTKSGREIMEILEAFDLTGCAHSAAQLAGSDRKTVARYVALREAGADPREAERRPRSVDGFLAKVEELVDRSNGRIRADV